MTTERKEEIPQTKLLEAVLHYQTTVYVTVFNIIQCIALAFLINEVRDVLTKEEISFAWFLRSAVAFAIVLIVWHRYVSEFQYLWPISWADTLGPFLIGIIECVIIFSITPKVISLDWFISGMASFQFLVAIGYGHAYLRRIMAITEKLYQNFYSDYPQFASHLVSFLKDYDWWHFKVFIVALSTSVVLLGIVILFPGDWNEPIVSIFYLVGIIQGEVRNNFQKALRKDKLIGPYFS